MLTLKALHIVSLSGVDHHQLQFFMRLYSERTLDQYVTPSVMPCDVFLQMMNADVVYSTDDPNKDMPQH